MMARGGGAGGGEHSLANSVLHASLATNISYPTRTRGIIVN